MPMGEPRRTRLISSTAAQVGGAMNPADGGAPPHWNVYFNVVDVDDAVAGGRELGGQGGRAAVRRRRAWAGWPCSPTRRARCSA